MTQEEKELLLKDLCARLPYGIMCQTDEHGKIHKLKGINKHKGIWWYEFDGFRNIKPPKPYLRPLSSMTEEEKRDLSSKYNWSIMGNDISIRYHSEGYWDDDTECPTNEYLKLFDWLNAHHFDYRGLIDLGLALVAPEGMYN